VERTLAKISSGWWPCSLQTRANFPLTSKAYYGLNWLTDLFLRNAQEILILNDYQNHFAQLFSKWYFETDKIHDLGKVEVLFLSLKSFQVLKFGKQVCFD